MRALRSSALFFLLAFLLSWYPYLLGKTHLVHTSGGINPLGPAVAALIVTGIFYRGRGIKELLARYLPWRAHWSNYVIAFALPVLLLVLAAAIITLLGAHRTFSTQVSSWPDLLPRFVFVFLFVGLGEETGWRGFALPELQKSYSPLVASLIIAVFWAAWHIPLMGVEFNGGLLPIPVLHATVNTIGAAYVFPMFTGSDNIRLWWLYALLWIVVAAALTFWAPKMKRRPSRSASTAQAVLLSLKYEA